MGASVFNPGPILAQRQQARQQDERFRALQDERGRSRQEAIKGQLVEMVKADAGINVDNIEPPDTDAATSRFVRELQKSLRKQQKSREEQGRAEGSINDLAQLQANRSPKDQAFESRFGDAFQNLSPGQRGDVQRKTALAGLESVGGLSGQTGPEAVTNRLADQTVGRIQRLDLVKTAASRLADSILAGDSDLDKTAQELAGEIVDATGKTRAEAMAIVNEAEFNSPEVAQRRKELRQSVTAGEKEFVGAVRDEIEAINEDFAGTGSEPVNPRDVRRLLRGRAVLDPLSKRIMGEPHFITVNSAMDGNKVMDTRRQQGVLVDQFGLARRAFGDMRDAAEAGGVLVGPFLGASFQDLAAVAGVQPASVAKFRNAQFEFVSSLLRARQGSRPSDFDMRMYLALMPLLTEVFSPAADAKLQALEDSLMVSLRAFGDEGRSRDIMRIKGQDAKLVGGVPVYSHPADKRMADSADKLQSAFESGEGIESAFMEFQREAGTWQAARGDKFVLPGIDVPASVGLSERSKAAIRDSLRP